MDSGVDGIEVESVDWRRIFLYHMKEKGQKSVANAVRHGREFHESTRIAARPKPPLAGSCSRWLAVPSWFLFWSLAGAALKHLRLLLVTYPFFSWVSGIARVNVMRLVAGDRAAS